MDSKDEVKEIHVIILIPSLNFNLDNILIDKKSYENILVYNISYKSLIDSKSLRIRFDKIDDFTELRQN